MKHNFTIITEIVYKSGGKTPGKYRLEWDSSKKAFESYITDVMDTLVLGEEPGTVDRIDIASVEFSPKVSEEAAAQQLKAFRESTNINVKF